MWALVVLLTMVGAAGCERITPVEAQEEIRVVDLQPPTLISPKNGRIISSTNRVTLRWRPSFAATGYSVQVARSLRFDVVLRSGETDTTEFVVELERGFVYYWRVMTRILPAYGSEWSEAWSFRILNQGEMIFD